MNPEQEARLSSDRIIIKSLERHTHGKLVAGGECLYHVNETTGYLHEFVGSAPAVEPGCYAHDAIDLLRVPGYRKVAEPPSPRPIVAEVAAPEPEPEPEPQAPPADLSILDLSVSKLRKALATGEHDASLAELLEAENAGKTRKGAVAALNERLNPSGA